MLLTEIPYSSVVYIDIERRGKKLSMTTTLKYGDKEGVYLDIPMLNGVDYVPAEEDKVFIRYKHDKRPLPLRWEVSEWGLTQGVGFVLLFFKSTAVAEPFTRRNGYREKVNLEAQANLEGFDKFNIFVKDISNVGVGFYTTESLKVGDLLTVSYKDGDFAFDLQATIVRCYDSEDPSKGIFYGAQLVKSYDIITRYFANRRFKSRKVN